jgi:rRNA maturation RNase YbeY
MKTPMPVTISRTIKKPVPTLPAQVVVQRIMGERYMLSLVFVGEKRAKRLNESYRGKTYVPNVLSFPLDKRTGEIFICPTTAKKEASRFGLSYRGYLTFLLIHGLLHLKGHAHGATMERLEQAYLKEFKVT